LSRKWPNTILMALTEILHDDGDNSKNERKKRGSFVLFWDGLRLFFHDQATEQRHRGIEAMPMAAADRAGQASGP
jgi:hypothetical protein